jgi:Leucine-rich repeat (LRR) protein
MTINELRKNLLEAYEVNNLNRISLTLINLFKNKQYTVLQKIAEIIGELVTINIREDGKGFSGFMMLYHPDRAVFHVSEINRLTEENNFDGLLGFSHIFKLERIEEVAASLNSFEDIDYSPVYDWDMETEGFTIFTDIRPPEKIKTTTKLIGYTFYDAIKLREFGTTDEEFPPYYLEDIDEFELSSSDINDLDGVQFCIHAKSIDLSNNRIADLSPLETLTNLEDLNLSDNEISYIDSIGFLSGLRSLNLSNNLIDDIEPLFGLKNLEYVDISGNKIDQALITKLTVSGITVDI